MPNRPFRPCPHVGCAELVVTGLCQKHAEIKALNDAEINRDRGTAHERGYTSKWREARLGYLRRHPLCASDKCCGRAVPASVVDHIIPHKGDMGLFWDTDNWQPLCKPCHDYKTGTEQLRH